MRILLSHVYCWPYVRRGNERHMQAVGKYLAGRGHEVITVSTKPGRTLRETTEAGRRVLWNPYCPAGLSRLRITPAHLFTFTSLATILRTRPAVAHCWSFTDCLASELASRFTRHATILQLNGAPVPGAYFRRFPPDRGMIRKAIRAADCRVACSQFIRNLIAEYYAVECRVMFPAADVDAFPMGPGPSDHRPTILAIGDLETPRKGLRPLISAFRMLKERLPDALLRLSGRLSDARARELLSPLPAAIARDIEVLGMGNPEDVPLQFQAASITVVPSMWEPSGGVMIESWASGTPVVATAHGGLPEFVKETVGVLFEPGTDSQEVSNVAGLADALLQGLRLAEQEGIRGRCRVHAEQYSFRALGTELEALYGELAG